ncbi:uncharacterized protein LOC121368052 [Gigantopelta aegis]|uniref:uncharacterized protein LOC121368052 n=1 Tax=Gigantopelta aegis TaxID=1735272 RepID=UPI001B88BD00|nr:uncharacterized protein LOC121368052 [Gigantopelta aegis]
MQNGKTSISECLDKLSSGSQDLSNRCIIVTQAEISVDAIKNSIALEKGDGTTPNGNTVNCSGDQDVVEVSHSIFNPTSESKMSKALSLRQRPVKYTNIWNKLTDKRQKTKPQLNTVNGFTPSDGEPKPIRPRHFDKSDSSASGNVSATSKAIVTTPLLSSIVLANDPFTFVPGQMCTPQVAFTAPAVLPSEKILPPVPENNDGFESSENLKVDSDSETSAAEELVEEVDNPVISYNDPDGKESTFDDGNCRETVINSARNGSSLDADAMSSPDNAGKKRQRKETKWSRVKRQYDDTKVDADGFSTPTSLDGENVAGELCSKSVSRMSESMSVVVVLKPSPAKSRKKQVIESNEASLETCPENPLISVSESLNVPDQTTPTMDVVSAASVTKPEASISHTLVSQESEDTKCNGSFTDLPASTESAKHIDEEAPANSVSNLPSEEDSDLKTEDTSSLHQQPVEKKKNPKKNSIEARAIRHQKQVIALQKARDARWQKRCLKAKQELIGKTSLDDEVE